MKIPSTPFPTTGYYGSEYFCDREAEVETLMRNLRGGESTTIVALRRMGKTALIRHLQHLAGNEFNSIYVDILPTESSRELLNSLATGVARMAEEQSGFRTRIWKFLKSLRPMVTYDSLSGAPMLSFSQSAEEGLGSIEEIFSFLEQQDKPVILAVDEFQQILKYREKQMDAWLRSRVQSLQNVRFIFSGSQQHLINQLFADPSRPFYRSTQFMKLEKINRKAYLQFIAGKFRENSKLISGETIESILQWADCYTYYVQLLCNRVFLSTRNEVAVDQWKEEAEKLLKEQEFVFYSYRDILTTPQWSLLKAIAGEGRVHEPTAQNFIRRNELGNASTVLRSLRALIKKEMIFREKDNDGKPYYGVYDILFRRWIEKWNT